MERRVQTPNVEASVEDGEEDGGSKTSPGGRRSVQVVNDNGKETEAAPSAPFKSSLRSSLRQDSPPAPTKRNERSVRVEKDRAGNRDRSRERPKNARSRSPTPQKRDLQVQTKGPRQVISLSSPSPQKGAGQTKRTDSVSSQKSDRSDRNHRTERYSEEYRLSLNDGPQPVRRLSSGSSGQAALKAPLAGSLSASESSQDVRVRKERPLSGSIGHLYGRPALDTASRRSSLDGGAASLRRPLKSPAAKEKEDKPVKTPPIVDEVERKRLADTLKERMESRKQERGSSLAQMMKAPLNRKGSMEEESRRSPLGARKELENDKTSNASLAPSRPVVSRIEKIQFTLAELRRQGRGGGRGGGGRGGRGGGGGRGYGRPPPPPLYDGPIEPLTVSENRWKPVKEKDASPLEKMMSHVKSLLNKLTREKFAKLTNELCAVEIDSFALLSSIVSIIMDKALEEPNFADVYADLCKEFHARTLKKSWSFLHVLSDEKSSFFWTAIDKATFASFAGPFESPHNCLEDAMAPESAATSTCGSESIPTAQFRRHGDCLVAVGEKEPGAFYYSKRKISEIGDDEPFGGPFESAELARHAASAQVTFTRLLVNRCQGEFEKTDEKKEEEVDPRRREILAMRAKAKMLGNIRFIGELYKVDLIKQSGVQGCIFYLLGLELIPGEDGQEVQAQAVRFPDEEDLEALCKMLATAGKRFDQPKTKTIMKIIILRMVELSEDERLPSRARFLVKDVLETRDHMWEPRRKELQQQTLDEVRREAQKLQQQGKNAQHDDVQRRRHKTRISSVQLAKQSSNLIVAKKEEPEEPEDDDDKELSPAQMSSRIKNIIHEYISILDLDEATTCVQELAVDPYHVEFAEQAMNTALEGKTSEREHAVELLVGLYERGALDANSIQAALVNVMEFLEDMRIDLPLIHQYSALIFGRLVAAGCFGLSWIISEALAHCVECKLTSLVFPEVLSVLEVESDEKTVIRMLTDEEITPESVLPAAVRANEADVQAYLRENGIEDFFGGGDSDEEDALDPEIAAKMRSTVEEYLSVKDFNEVVQCIKEFEADPDRWRHFAHVVLAFSLEAKQSVRSDVAELLVQLFSAEHVTSDDIAAAVESILDDYDDLRVDIPQLAVNLSELWTPLFAKQALSVQWLREACSHLVESGRAADVLDALLSALEASEGQEALVAWWKQQSDVDAVWTQMSPAAEDDKPLDERLAKWKLLLQ
uniref:MI domain-containing protein n=1 Tax=Phytophthora ramorum TaxID=164328 RepID=H3HC25_PHYRM